MGSTSINELFEVNLESNEVAFIYLGFAGIILRTKEKAIAIDVGEKCLNSRDIMEIKNLDIQLYSHTHWDHFNIDVTTKIFAKTKANIVAEPQVFEELKSIMASEGSVLYSAKPRGTIILNGLEVAIVGGIHPRPISIFRIKWDNFSIFHGADSGPVPLGNYPANVAFLPTGTPSPTCSPENALKMALDIKPRTIVAMHGRQVQMEKFKAIAKKKMPNVTVVIPKQNEVMKIIS
ncbi:MAG: MBL fold metallo-hydrolase [Candidatus Hodarchaeota archaeon]